MAEKKNCWEVMRCGREPGGARVAELGECPAATYRGATGVNGGVCGGRLCWAITGTLCGGATQGTFAEKQVTCLSCEFYGRVRREEGLGFLMQLPRLSERRARIVGGRSGADGTAEPDRPTIHGGRPRLTAG